MAFFLGFFFGQILIPPKNLKEKLATESQGYKKVRVNLECVLCQSCLVRARRDEKILPHGHRVSCIEENILASDVCFAWRAGHVHTRYNRIYIDALCNTGIIV